MPLKLLQEEFDASWVLIKSYEHLLLTSKHSGSFDTHRALPGLHFVINRNEIYRYLLKWSHRLVLYKQNTRARTRGEAV